MTNDKTIGTYEISLLLIFKSHEIDSGDEKKKLLIFFFF